MKLQYNLIGKQVMVIYTGFNQLTIDEWHALALEINAHEC